MTEQEYILKIMDGGYADRFRKNYNEDMKIHMHKSLETKLGEMLEGEIKPEELFSIINQDASNYKDIQIEIGKPTKIKDIIPMILEKKNMVNIAGRFFSQIPLSLYKFEKNEKDNLPSCVIKEYFEPFFKEFANLKAFVDDVREKAEEISPKEITNKNVDNEFLKRFKGHKEFTSFYLSWLDTLYYIYDVALDGKEKDIQLRFVDASKEIAPYVFEKIFSDLN